MAQEMSVLRRRLREEWRGPGELVWVEHAPGGTEGAPDVFVPLGARGYCPVELKWWEYSPERKVIKYRARPAQVRFHRLAHNAGQRTAFLALLNTGAFVMLGGGHFPKNVANDDQLRRALSKTFFLPEDFASHIVGFLSHPDMWR